MRLSLRPLQRIALAIVVPASLLLVPSAAHAADSTAVVALQQLPATTAVQAASSCAITEGSYTGHYLCATSNQLEANYANGTHEVFIVGLDHAVWHIWQRYKGDPVWSGWRSLGGWAGDGVWGTLPNGMVTLKVVGSDYRYWCDQRGPPWSGWYRC